MTRTDYNRESGMVDAAREFFNRYVDFQGRSNRGEFWYWALDNLIVTLIIGFIEGSDGGILSFAWGLATLIPSIALGIRRLHDTDRTGWWLLIAFIPLIGALVLLYFFVQKPSPGPNRFG